MTTQGTYIQNLSSTEPVVSEEMSLKGKSLMIHRIIQNHHDLFQPDGGQPKVPTYKISAQLGQRLWRRSSLKENH